MVRKKEQFRMREMLSEAIMVLCKASLEYRTEFSVEGLIGITLDNEEIFLINLNEKVKKEGLASRSPSPKSPKAAHSKRPASPPTSSGQRPKRRRSRDSSSSSSGIPQSQAASSRQEHHRTNHDTLKDTQPNAPIVIKEEFDSSDDAIDDSSNNHCESAKRPDPSSRLPSTKSDLSEQSSLSPAPQKWTFGSQPQDVDALSEMVRGVTGDSSTQPFVVHPVKDANVSSSGGSATTPATTDNFGSHLSLSTDTSIDNSVPGCSSWESLSADQAASQQQSMSGMSAAVKGEPASEAENTDWKESENEDEMPMMPDFPSGQNIPRPTPSSQPPALPLQDDRSFLSITGLYQGSHHAPASQDFRQSNPFAHQPLPSQADLMSGNNFPMDQVSRSLASIMGSNSPVSQVSRSLAQYYPLPGQTHTPARLLTPSSFSSQMPIQPPHSPPASGSADIYSPDGEIKKEILDPQSEMEDPNDLSQERDIAIPTMPSNVSSPMADALAKAISGMSSGFTVGPRINSRRPCGICGKTFKTLWFLKSHMRIHTGEKPFKCSLCGKAFAEKSNLRKHFVVHRTQKEYQCPICAKPFAILQSCKAHMLQMHNEDATSFHPDQLKRQPSENDDV